MAATREPTGSELRAAAVSAAAAREAAHAKVADIARTVQHCRRIAEPNIGAMAEGPLPTIEEVLTARSQMVRAEQALADAQLAAFRADRNWEEADTALREALRAEFRARKRAAIPKLAAMLLAARSAVDELAVIEDEEQNALGPEFMRERFSMAWNGLKSGSSTFDPLLDSWCRAAIANGLLPNDESAAKK